jgi:hypothetical protein
MQVTKENTPRQPGSDNYLKLAERSLQIAMQVLRNVRSAEKEAARQIACAWYGLAGVYAGNRGESAEFSFDCLSQIKKEDLKFSQVLSAEQWENDLRSYFSVKESSFLHEEGKPEFDALRLEAHCDLLEKSIKRIKRCPDLCRKKFWPLRTKTACAVFILLLAAIFCFLYCLSKKDKDLWRAEFFENISLTGAPQRVVAQNDINYAWTWVGPFNDFPADNYSVRWESIMQVAYPLEVTFELGSDDGSRMFVDDKPVIDLWSAHPYQTAAAIVSLTPGNHTLRVEYFQISASAEIRLKAAFSDGVFEPLPGNLLRSPE